MKVQSPFREPTRVLWHGNGGVTCVSLTRYDGQGLANGGVKWDIATGSIPIHLRAIGSEFLVICPRFTPEDGDSIEDVRRMCASVEVRELQPDDT